MKKDEQIRMLLHPEKYEDEQLNQMLDGLDISVPDAEEALVRITNSRQRGWYVIAASIFGILMLSGVAYAAINHFIMVDEKPEVAMTERKPDIEKVEKTYGAEMTPTKKAPVVFNNVELQQIMQYVAEGYNVKVEFRNKTACTIRFYLQWEADDTLQEIIDKINHFDKVHLTFNEGTIVIQ
jgi:hypothetical protein